MPDLQLLVPPVAALPQPTEAALASAGRDMLVQIARLERELAELIASTPTAAAVRSEPTSRHHGRRSAAPRVVEFGELESVRDGLVSRLAEARAEVGRRAEAQEASRGVLERMLVDPAEQRWGRVSNVDVGEPGCKHWHSRPRFGILGMLLGWWRVKVSSGCPLAGGPRRPAPRLLRTFPDATS